MHLSYLGQYPVLSHPEFPQGVPWWGGVVAVADDLMAGVLFPSGVPSMGATVVADGCNILCLLIWQVAFLVHTKIKKNSTEDRGGLNTRIMGGRHAEKTAWTGRKQLKESIQKSKAYKMQQRIRKSIESVAFVY